MAIYTYQFAELPPFDNTLDPDVATNAANADFVGPSPALVKKTVLDVRRVPMRLFKAGDTIKFDFSKIIPADPANLEVYWNCEMRTSNIAAARIFMGASNRFKINHGAEVAVNAIAPPLAFGELEHWGLWADITLTVGNEVRNYSTADPEGVIGNGA